MSGTRVSKGRGAHAHQQESGKITAADLNRHTRNHWEIENKGHYVRDTVYYEDHCQAWAGQGSRALASLRNLAIGLIRLKGVTAIEETTEWMASDRLRALKFMAT